MNVTVYWSWGAAATLGKGVWVVYAFMKAKQGAKLLFGLC